MNNKIDLESVLPGTLSRVSSTRGEFFHLTWKESGKTVTRYVRLDEVKTVEKGIKLYQKAKEILDRAARKNLSALFKARNSK
jgi:hypothetical protein